MLLYFLRILLNQKWYIIELHTVYSVRFVPSLRTKTISLSMTVGILCATVMTVQSLVSSLIVFWIKLSVAVSMDAVASSRTKIRLLFSNNLARQTSCRCPRLQFSPFSATAQVFVMIKRMFHINNMFFYWNKDKTKPNVI